LFAAAFRTAAEALKAGDRNAPFPLFRAEPLRSLGTSRGGHFRRQRNSLLPFRARRGTQQPEEARDVAACLNHQLFAYAMQFLKNLVVRHFS
jgi:hypothetical protein